MAPWLGGLRRVRDAAFCELARLGADAVRSAGLVAALISLPAAVCGLLGGAFSLLDVLSHLAVLWLLLGLFAAATGLALERRAPNWRLILGLSAAVVSFALIAPELAGVRPGQKAEPGEQQLKLIQFNVWEKNSDPERAARWILAQNPDIVLLEEVEQSPIRGLLRTAYPHQITCVHPANCSPVILLKRPPQANGGAAIPPEANQTWVRIGEDNPFTVLVLHQAKPYDRKLQAENIRLTARRLAGFDQAGLIVGGDFNSTPWSWSLRRQDKIFGLERRTRALSTWPAWTPAPLLPIDHVYAGTDWRTVKVSRGPRLGSDHYPVVVTLSRRARHAP